MPDEILYAMEEDIIRRYMEKLKSILMSDERIEKDIVQVVIEDMDNARDTYTRMYNLPIT